MFASSQLWALASNPRVIHRPLKRIQDESIVDTVYGSNLGKLRKM